MYIHAVQTARALYREGTFSLVEAARYLGCSPAYVRRRFGPHPSEGVGGGSGGGAVD